LHNRKPALFIVNNNRKQWLKPLAAGETAALPAGGAGSAWDDAWRFSLMPAAWKIRIALVES
jgi:hypothetical protein